MSRVNNKNKEFIVTLGVFTIAVLALGTMTTAYAQQAQAAAEGVTGQSGQNMIDTQLAANRYVTDDERNAGSTEYTSRWSPVIVAEPETLTAIFADCNEGEYAVSGQHLFEVSRDLEEVHSLSVSLPDNFMTWLIIVANYGDDPKDASAGVICADESGEADDSSDNIDYETKKTINNAVNKIIRQQGSLDIDFITKVYQIIIQNAVNIVNITGNNNTVNQIINQSANQIVLQNATTPEQINQIINATTTAAAPSTTTTITPSTPSMTTGSGNNQTQAPTIAEEGGEAPTTTMPPATTTPPTEGEEEEETTTPPTEETPGTTTPSTEEEEEQAGEETTGDDTTTTQPEQQEPEQEEEPEEEESNEEGDNDGGDDNGADSDETDTTN